MQKDFDCSIEPSIDQPRGVHLFTTDALPPQLSSVAQLAASLVVELGAGMRCRRVCFVHCTTPLFNSTYCWLTCTPAAAQVGG